MLQEFDLSLRSFFSSYFQGVLSVISREDNLLHTACSLCLISQSYESRGKWKKKLIKTFLGQERGTKIYILRWFLETHFSTMFASQHKEFFSQSALPKKTWKFVKNKYFFSSDQLEYLFILSCCLLLTVEK